MRNKYLILLILLLLSLTAFSHAFAQETEETAEPTLAQQFPRLYYFSHFYENLRKHNYRFPTLVPFFEPIDLAYFPHESWNVSDWSLLSRWDDTWTYNQLIMLKQPAGGIVTHGTALGMEHGMLSDFYLYATLFVTDNYPEGTGSCYVYYSDSLIQGFGTSSGIFIDPLYGISEIDNTYQSYYRLTNSKHEMTILKPLEADAYPLNEEDIAASSHAANDFSGVTMDNDFVRDLNAVRSASHMPGSTVRAVRLEIIRQGSLTQIYINGHSVVSFDDGIHSVSESGGFSPARVSWSYGPVLYEGGETVTCSIGDLYIFAPADTEDK